MKITPYLRVFSCVSLLLGAASLAAPVPTQAITLVPISSVNATTPGISAAEIVAHDPSTQRLYVVNAFAAQVDVFQITDPAQPKRLFSINVKPYGSVANSLAVKNGVLAVAVEASNRTDPGQVVFFNSFSRRFLGKAQVGAVPDMLTFTPDGRNVLTANEGEPSFNYTVDPKGSVSIIDVSGGFANPPVRTVGFEAFDAAELRSRGIRIFGPNASAAQDLEPEYLTVSEDSNTAWVTLQENNALGIIDIPSGTVSLVPLGTKDYTFPGNATRPANKLDPSDRDPQVNGAADANNDGVPDGINIRHWPVLGMYQPDALANYKVGGQTYLVLANEGDARDYVDPINSSIVYFSEQVRVATLTLDPTAFPNGTNTSLKNNAVLGRLRVSNASGNPDGDGDFDQLYAFGARSFSIRTAEGELVWDSGDEFEQIIAADIPQFFNASHDNNTFDDRSDDKGPEPEGVVLGEVAGRTYAFIGLERVGGIVIYDITNPQAPVFTDYVNNRNFSKPVTDPLAGDLGPEGIIFITAADSPNGIPLVVIGNEVSGTTTIFEVRPGVLNQ